LLDFCLVEALQKNIFIYIELTLKTHRMSCWIHLINPAADDVKK